jgi:alkyl sulfatase BDS1-like metallo-beta-lactamase superfamily hydrolase
MTGEKDVQPETKALNAAVRGALAFNDTRDFADASRGLVAAAPAETLKRDNGFPIWDMAAYDFEDAVRARLLRLGQPTACARFTSATWASTTATRRT